jgi:hypothetical protein
MNGLFDSENHASIGLMSKMDYGLCNTHPLLGIDSQISSYKTAVVK